jgi:hypothetical protein
MRIVGQAGDGLDLVGQFGVGGDGTLVAGDGPVVLGDAVDAGLAGPGGGGGQQVRVAGRVGCEGGAVVGLRDGLRIGRRRKRRWDRPMRTDRRPAPGLDATGDHAVGLSAGDQAGGEGDGVQAGVALAVDAQGGDAVGQPGGQRGHAGGVAAGAQGVADQDHVDGCGGQAAAGQQAAQHGRAELVGAQGGQGTADGRDGAAPGGDDQDVSCSHVGTRASVGPSTAFVSTSSSAAWSVLPLRVRGQCPASAIHQRRGSL